MKIVVRLAPVLTILFLVACANEEDKGALRDRSVIPAPREELPKFLSKELLARYVKALTEMRQQGITDDSPIGDDLGLPAEMARRMLFGPPALSVMRKHGLEHAELRQVRGWVLMAYGALQFEAKRDELEAERERDLRASERLKGKMSEEAYEQMRTQIEESVASLDLLYRGVSANDRELVGAQIEVHEALLK